MSVEAITWALSQPVKHSSAKFVLVVLANRADGDMICWPSMVDICKQTGQDRKTVQENIRRLRDAGFIEDTNERKGSTKQVIVYRLKTPKNGPVEHALDTPPTSTKGTENGPVKEAQIRNTSENGTGPKFPLKRPEIPTKEARNSLETGPKTGHGTINEPSIETSGKPQRQKSEPDDFDPLNYPLANNVSEQVAKDWLRHRKAKKADASKTSIDGHLREATKAAMSLEAALAMAVERGWIGFKSSWITPEAQSPPGGARLGKAGQATAANAQRLLERERAKNEQSN